MLQCGKCYVEKNYSGDPVKILGLKNRISTTFQGDCDKLQTEEMY